MRITSVVFFLLVSLSCYHLTLFPYIRRLSCYLAIFKVLLRTQLDSKHNKYMHTNETIICRVLFFFLIVKTDSIVSLLTLKKSGNRSSCLHKKSLKEYRKKTL